jgi:hypothetical protein
LYTTHVRPYNPICSVRLSFTYAQTIRKTFSCCANVSCFNEIVATNTYFSDTSALYLGLLGHGGTKVVQLFCVCQSLLTAVYHMRCESNISGTLEDFFRTYGVPNSLFSDNDKSLIGNAVQKILRIYGIKDSQCEPHH